MSLLMRWNVSTRAPMRLLATQADRLKRAPSTKGLMSCISFLALVLRVLLVRCGVVIAPVMAPDPLPILALVRIHPYRLVLVPVPLVRLGVTAGRLRAGMRTGTGECSPRQHEGSNEEHGGKARAHGFSYWQAQPVPA